MLLRRVSENRRKTKKWAESRKWAEPISGRGQVVLACGLLPKWAWLSVAGRVGGAKVVAEGSCGLQTQVWRAGAVDRWSNKGCGKLVGSAGAIWRAGAAIQVCRHSTPGMQAHSSRRETVMRENKKGKTVEKETPRRQRKFFVLVN